MRVVFLLITLIISTPVYARIGETTVQLQKRYGRPLKTQSIPEETLRYSFQGFTILVGLDQGISQCEVYEKTDGTRMTEGEIGVLLDANADPQSPWRVDPEESINNYIFWSRNKKSRVAIYNLASHKLLITSKPFLKRFAHLAASSKPKEIEGF